MILGMGFMHRGNLFDLCMALVSVSLNQENAKADTIFFLTSAAGKDISVMLYFLEKGSSPPRRLCFSGSQWSSKYDELILACSISENI